MLRIVAFATALLVGSSVFAQDLGELPLLPSVPPLPSLPSEIAVDHAGLVLKRVATALDRARARFERRSLHIFWLPEERDSDGEFLPLQISWAPGLAIPFGYYDVGLSLGVIGALTRDVQGLALASVMNITRDVEGAALGGVFNISRNIEGAQLAGVFNIASASVSALQGAGIFNIAGDGVQGAQLAGIFSIAGGPVDGAQVSGIFNIAGDVQGFQGAGLFDIADDYSGPIQVAGLFTIAKRVQGAQVAGLFNVADRVQGAQISSLVNAARRVEGIQIGLVNVADRIEGVQFGLINIAKNGVGGVGELYEGNGDYQWAFWQNGTRWFYTVFMAGSPKTDWGKSAANLVFSAGAGSRLSLGRAYFDLELAALEKVGASALSLQGDFGAAPSSWASLPDSLVRAAKLLPDRPWPALRLSFGIPILWRLHFIAGARIDLDLERWGLPEEMKTGFVARNQNVLGLGFTSYTKWYFGLRI